MRVLVCGGRNYNNEEVLFRVLDGYHELDYFIDTILQGGATGADALAAKWATSRGVTCEVYFPDWKKFGPSAGPKRNQRMIDQGNPGVVIAFPGGRGTADMVRRAKRANIEVIEIAE